VTEISAMKFAVVGSPISHSLSPSLHTAAFRARGLPHSYEAFQVENLSQWLGSRNDLAGLSVTMPLKEQALALSSDLDSAAQATDSVNTLIRRGDAWFGANTDVVGIKFALRGLDLSRVVVVGSGATARSALFALQGVSDLRILARNTELAKALSVRFSARLADPADLESATVVSTLPAGALERFIVPDLRPTGALLDVAYHPWPSGAAIRWMEHGQAISGVEMLIGQAVAQQRLFAPNDFDEPVVLAAMREALGMKE
jgi:shikimate dehydrogenase